VLTPHDLAGRAVALNAVTELLWAYRLGRTAARLLRDSDLVVSNGIWGSWVDSSVPRVNVFHGTWAGYYIMGQWRSPRKWVGKRVRTWLERRSGRNAINVAVSESVKKEVEQYYGLAVACVIENGVDLKRFTPPTTEAKRSNKAQLGLDPDKIVALYVGRMEWGKGIDRLNELAGRVKSSDLSSAVEFCVVTPRIEKSFFSRHVRYVMGNNMDRVLQAYQAADVLLFPSRYEGWGFAVFEALASGVPVIGTPTGAMQMIKQRDQELGRYIADDFSVEALLMNLENYLGLSQEEREELSWRARRYAEEWASLELFCQKWTTLIEGLGDHG
jgi:glycosyltransferase involved in cell wall biosynthesis